MGLLGNFSGSFDADSLMQGAKLGANLADVWQRSYDESYDRQRRDSARDAFGKAWASGDQGAVDRVMQQFPEFAEQAQKFIGVRDEQHRKDLGSLMSKISAMAQSGDYQGILSLVDKNGRVLDADSSALLKNAANAAIHADDKTSAAAQQALMQSTDAIARVALTPQELSLEQFRQRQQEETERRDREAHEDRRSQLAISDARLNEIADFHNQMLELKRQSILNAGGGDVMADTQGNPLTPFDYNRLLLQSGTDPRTGKRATGAQLSNAQKWMAGNESFTSAQETLHQQLGKIDDLLSGDKLESGTGRFAGRAPSLLTSGEGIDVRNLLDSIKSGEFTTNVQKLRGMGALSNAEGAKLMDLTAKIDETQPTDVIRKQLKAIRDQYRALAKANLQDAADMGYGQRKLQAYAGGSDDVSGMSDDDLLEGL